MKNKFVLLAILFVFAFACNNKNTPPTLTITTPTEGATIIGPVNITGITTDKSLHLMTIKITKDADASVLFIQEIPDVHDLTSYNFNVTYNPTGINVATDVTLTIIVEDHQSLSTTNTVHFKLMP
jgi:hypothetical protein